MIPDGNVLRIGTGQEARETPAELTVLNGAGG
jgi:hypothetical protein